MIKKNVLVICILAMFLGLYSIAFGADISSSEEIKLAKEKIQQSFGINMGDREDFIMSVQKIMNERTGKNDTHVSWYKDEIDNSQNYFVCIDGRNSTTTSFGRSKVDFVDTQDNVKIEKDKAKQIAKKYIEAINPNELKDTVFKDETIQDSPVYSFKYIRTINDIEVEPDYVNVEINKFSGEITYYAYYKNIDEKELEDIKNTIDEKKANKIFLNNLDMRLNYVLTDELNNDKPYAKLKYSPIFEKGYNINASTGQLIQENYETYDIVFQMDEICDKEKNKISENFDEKINKVNMNEKDIEKLAKSYLKELTGKNKEILKIKNIKDKNSLNENIWEITFCDKGSRINEGSLKIDNNTKDIVFFYNDEPYNQDVKITKKDYEQAYKTAIEYVSEKHGDKIKHLNTEQTIYGQNFAPNGLGRYVTFEFNRKEHGIDYYNDNITIVIDAKNNSISNVYFGWNNELTFQDTKNIVSIEDAKQRYLDSKDIKLMYKLIEDINGQSIKLAYSLLQDEAFSMDI